MKRCSQTDTLRRNTIKALAALALLAGLESPASASEPLRIVALGDSLVAGYGLPLDEGFVPQLQRWADGTLDAPVRIENAGVSGDTSAGGLARLDWAIGTPAPDGLILELGANDMLRGIDPAETRANLHAILERMQAAEVPVLLVGMMATRNLGADYVAEFEAIYPELAEEFDAVLMPFFLDGLDGKPEYAQDDGMHPSAAGVAVMVERFAPYFRDLLARIGED